MLTGTILHVVKRVLGILNQEKSILFLVVESSVMT